MSPITRINIYRSRGEWCYAAFSDAEFDHSDPVDLRNDAGEADVRAEMTRQFPEVEIRRVPDVN